MKKLIFILIFSLFLLSCKDHKAPPSSEKNTFSKIENVPQASNDTIDRILKITLPKSNQRVSSPLQLEGEARGYWFFEADAPVELLSEDFQLMAESFISAKGEWMTESWVPFEGVLEFPTPSTSRGFLVFHKANPSGLKENAMSDTLEISFRN